MVNKRYLHKEIISLVLLLLFFSSTPSVLAQMQVEKEFTYNFGKTGELSGSVSLSFIITFEASVSIKAGIDLPATARVRYPPVVRPEQQIGVSTAFFGGTGRVWYDIHASWSLSVPLVGETSESYSESDDILSFTVPIGHYTGLGSASITIAEFEGYSISFGIGMPVTVSTEVTGGMELEGSALSSPASQTCTWTAEGQYQSVNSTIKSNANFLDTLNLNVETEYHLLSIQLGVSSVYFQISGPLIGTQTLNIPLTPPATKTVKEPASLQTSGFIGITDESEPLGSMILPIFVGIPGGIIGLAIPVVLIIFAVCFTVIGFRKKS
jgi:hypothetical protein